MPEGSTAHSDSSPFEAVFVCTGNRARSPFAAALLNRLAPEVPVMVRSFGVLDVGPLPALPEAIWAAGMLGIDLTPHRARGLSGRRLDTAGLVIGFEQFHLATAVVEARARRERTFLLTELAALVGRMGASADSVTSPEALIELVDSSRTRAPSLGAPIADPVGRSKEEFLSVFEDISALVRVIAGELFSGASSRVGS